MSTLLGLELADRLVLVAGGGQVAARQVREMLSARARVRLVSPGLCPEMAELRGHQALSWRRREVLRIDVFDAWLVLASTGDPRLDERLCGWADEQRVWCVNTSRADAGSASALTGVNADDPGPVGPSRGRVILVGGGPGDPGLITLRGLRALLAADVVVADRLGPRGLLAGLSQRVEVIDVGKSPGNHPVPQEEINQLLVARAQAGALVVRLKGGDPFVLGRGGEEVLACRAAGVPVEVVPGISSAVAVPAAAGIPITQRGLATAVHVVTGHGGLSASEVTALRDRTATVVVLMGVGNLAGIATAALAGGVTPGTPVAVVENGTLPGQRVTRACLADLADQQRCAEIGTPAVIVIGQVAALDLNAMPDPRDHRGSAGRAVTHPGARRPDPPTTVASSPVGV